MGILFVVFALVIVIVSGIPMAKKKLEENKKFKEYTENTQLGKNEIVCKRQIYKCNVLCWNCVFIG